MKPRPPLTRVTHPLPFEKLGPVAFGRLCLWLWLVRREDYEQAEHYGAKGSDQGRDIVAYRDGRRVVFQCKRVERFEPAEAEKELAELLELPVEAQDMVFVVSFKVNRRVEIRGESFGDDGGQDVWC